MNAKNLVFNDCRKAEVIKDFGAVTPHIDRAVLPEALIVKAVNLSVLKKSNSHTNTNTNSKKKRKRTEKKRKEKKR